jgi:hypothetical protein
MYIWFCQYLLIWYANHPDETTYLLRRSVGPWRTLLLLSLGLNWGIPFLFLLFRDNKRSPFVLAAIALVLLAGRWVDLFVMIFPTQGEMPPNPGNIEIGLMLGAAGFFALTVLGALTQASLVPVHDPYLLKVGPIR